LGGRSKIYRDWFVQVCRGLARLVGIVVGSFPLAYVKDGWLWLHIRPNHLDISQSGDVTHPFCTQV